MNDGMMSLDYIGSANTFTIICFDGPNVISDENRQVEGISYSALKVRKSWRLPWPMMTNRRMRGMYTSLGPDGGGPPVITDTADVGGGMINISTT